MAKDLKELVEKLKQRKENSQSSEKVEETPEKIVEEDVDLKLDEVEEKTEETPEKIVEEDVDLKLDEVEEKTEEEKSVEKVEEIPKIPEKDVKIREQLLMEIEMLQNDGRFRVELLHQLQELNKGILLIGEILINSSENDK